MNLLKLTKCVCGWVGGGALFPLFKVWLHIREEFVHGVGGGKGNKFICLSIALL